MRLRATAKPKKTVQPVEWADVLAPKIINQFIGSHIAIVHKKVVAAGETLEGVIDEAERLFPEETPYYAYIPAGKDPSDLGLLLENANEIVLE